MDIAGGRTRDREAIEACRCGVAGPERGALHAQRPQHLPEAVPAERRGSCACTVMRAGIRILVMVDPCADSDDVAGSQPVVGNAEGDGLGSGERSASKLRGQRGGGSHEAIVEPRRVARRVRMSNSGEPVVSASGEDRVWRKRESLAHASRRRCVELRGMTAFRVEFPRFQHTGRSQPPALPDVTRCSGSPTRR